MRRSHLTFASGRCGREPETRRTALPRMGRNLHIDPRFGFDRCRRTCAKGRCPRTRRRSCASHGLSTVLSATARSSSRGTRSTSTPRTARTAACVSSDASGRRSCTTPRRSSARSRAPRKRRRTRRRTIPRPNRTRPRTRGSRSSTSRPWRRTPRIRHPWRSAVP